MALADDLLEQAMHLACRERGRPKQASLRRAVSTAYDALFHLLTGEAARNWKNGWQRPAFKRSLDHGRMKQASEKLRQNPQAVSTAAKHLLLVAKAFVELQQKRHAADYDDSKTWSRMETISLIHRAEEAFASWAAIREETLAQDYLLALFLKDR